MKRTLGILLLTFLAQISLAWAQPRDDLGQLAKEAQSLLLQGQTEAGLEKFRGLEKACRDEFGAKHPFVSWAQNCLAEGYRVAGQPEQALKEYDRALSTARKSLGAEHEMIGGCLLAKGKILKQLGRYYKAEDCLEEALAVIEIVRGPEDTNSSIALTELASVKGRLGHYSEAALLMERVLQSSDGMVAESIVNSLNLSIDPVDSRVELGRLYRLMGDYKSSEEILQQKLAFVEANFAEGDDTKELASTLYEVSKLRLATGKREEAREPLFRAIDMWNKSGQRQKLGPAVIDGANLLLELGDVEGADAFQAIAMETLQGFVPPNHPALIEARWLKGRVMRSSGQLSEAAAVYRDIIALRTKLFPEDPVLASSWEELALTYREQQMGAKALEAARQADEYRLKQLESLLSLTNERQRMVFQQSWKPYDLLATLGSAPELARSLLRYKGVVLDSVMEDKLYALAGEEPELVALVEKLQQARERLAELNLEPEKPLSEVERLERMAEGPALRRDIDLWEKQLAKSFTNLGKSRRALTVEVSEVQDALPPDSVLVEFVKYSQRVESERVPSYGAVVLSNDKAPVWVPLGPARTIEKMGRRYQRMVRKRSRARAALLGEQKEKVESHGALSGLYQLIWEPIDKVLPQNTKLLLLSPDAQLNFVSFAALTDSEGRFLAEKYGVLYVATGRDLLSKPSTSVSESGPAIFVGNPEYTVAQTEKTTDNDLRGSLLRLNFPSLPGTAIEVTKLVELAEDDAIQLTGSEATEKRLGEARSPRLMHLATHGFFLPARRELTATSLGNPMNRSGLAFAGAQITARLWSKGMAPADPSNDGILTAQEVGRLKLDGTDLVTLSACDTGSGVARAGEGVLGLRRGFAQAGAKNLIMTLWPVDDAQTAEFMMQFYARMQKGEPISQALLSTQRESLRRLREKFGTKQAVRFAGPFVLSIQGGVDL